MHLYIYCYLSSAKYFSLAYASSDLNVNMDLPTLNQMHAPLEKKKEGKKVKPPPTYSENNLDPSTAHEIAASGDQPDILAAEFHKKLFVRSQLDPPSLFLLFSKHLSNAKLNAKPSPRKCFYTVVFPDCYAPVYVCPRFSHKSDHVCQT